MTDSEFARLADDTLARIEAALDDCAVDIDCEVHGGVVQLTFPNGSQIILNKQPAVHELWLAAKAGGFHYTWQEGQWRNTRDGSELSAALNRYASAQAGEAVNLAI